MLNIRAMMAAMAAMTPDMFHRPATPSCERPLGPDSPPNPFRQLGQLSHKARLASKPVNASALARIAKAEGKRLRRRIRNGWDAAGAEPDDETTESYEPSHAEVACASS